MSRRTPPWRHSCLFITGVLALTGCSEGVEQEESPPLQQQARALMPGPDLRITELTAPDNAKPGQPVSVTAKVCNTGDQAVYANTQLQVYLSTTPTQQMPGPGTPPPPTQQLLQGQTDVGTVYAGQCVSRSLSIYITPPSGFTGNGAYYLGAIVDAFQAVQESDETNNGFVRGLMGVGSRPDLIVTRVDAPASLAPGQSFSATATVCNTGTESSSVAAVQLYLSTVNGVTMPSPSGPPPATQAMLGGTSIASLAAGQCRMEPIMGNVQMPPTPVPPGTPLYLGAIADAQANVVELREDNNAFVQGLVGVGNGPDLVVRSVTGPASVRQGDPLQATVTVCNAGTQSSNSADVMVVLSTGTSLAAPSSQPRPPTEAPVGNANVPPLSVGQCATRTVQGYAYRPYSPPGEQPLYLGAIVDLPRSVQELREDNNTRADTLVGVGTQPDLTVVTLEAPTNLPLSGPFTVSTKLCNVGTTRSMDSLVEVYITSEPSLAITAGPPPMTAMMAGSANVPALEPRECITRQVSSYGTVPPGATMPNPTLYVGAVVDPRASLLELREDNNVSALSRIGMGSGPDLVVRTLTAPSSVKPATSLWTDVQVCNEGTQFAPNSTVGLFLSTTPTAVSPVQGPPPSQMQIGSVEVSSLQPGACALYTKSVYAAAPPPGAPPSQPLYLVALADVGAQQQELREDNNLGVAGPLLLGNGPDLVVTDVTGPTSAIPYGPVTLNVTVCNTGTDPAGPSRVMGVVSAGETLPTQFPSPGATESVVGEVSLPPLAAGQCVTTPVSGSAPPPYYAEPNSPLYLGARVDSTNQVMELREDNNTRVTSRLVLGNGPDLVVRSVTAPTNPTPYSAFSAQVKICNEGNVSTYGSVPLDLVISTEKSPYVPGQGQPPYTQVQMPVGGVMVPALAVGQCTTLPVQGSFNRPPAATPGQSLYLGAIVDGPNTLQELIEDNNALTMATSIGQAP
ncbi:CARDB domain-containing protein [Corallococcus sp. EGB]|uniref:CARDB domain-containing protein n=1 Tax=Corallococcus sp. EGB TaxID=1521117 RepID=UPI001CC19A89|nr:CARDB domain-containing protein [Corallococcus sp. EGB]